MTVKIKTKTEVNGVPVINRHAHKMGYLKELIRFDKKSSVFKKWNQTVRSHKTKPFAGGFVSYQHD